MTNLFMVLKLTFEGEIPSAFDLLGDLEHAEAYPTRIGHDDAGVRIVTYATMASVTDAKIVGIFEQVPPPEHQLATELPDDDLATFAVHLALRTAAKDGMDPSIRNPDDSSAMPYFSLEEFTAYVWEVYCSGLHEMCGDKLQEVVATCASQYYDTVIRWWRE